MATKDIHILLIFLKILIYDTILYQEIFHGITQYDILIICSWFGTETSRTNLENLLNNFLNWQGSFLESGIHLRRLRNISRNIEGSKLPPNFVFTLIKRPSSTGTKQFDIKQIATKWISTEKLSHHYGISAETKRPFHLSRIFFISIRSFKELSPKMRKYELMKTILVWSLSAITWIL